MINGITNDYVHAVAIYSTDDLSAAQLYQKTWDVVLNLEMKKIKVISITCDGAPINKKFFRMHVSANPEVEDFVYVTKNIACGEKDRCIFLLIHLMS